MPDDITNQPDIPPPAGTRSVPDIAYGPHERQKLDLYLPPGVPRGVVAYIHGGNWARRDRKTVRAWYLLDRGYAVASLGYRLSQHAFFPAQIRDVNRALGKLARIAPEHGLEMDRLALLGLSAGGHLAALAALARDEPAFAPSDAVTIRAVVDYYGPSNLITLGGAGARRDCVLNEAVTQLLGHNVSQDPVAALGASPVSRCHQDSPAFLLIHGDADRVVPVTESLNLQAHLLASGASAQLIVIRGGGHATRDMHTADIHGQICAFLDTHFTE